MDETLLRFGDVVRLKLADRSRALYVRGEGHVLASVVAKPCKTGVVQNTTAGMQFYAAMSSAARPYAGSE